MTSPAIEKQPGLDARPAVILIKEALDDYVLCRGQLPPGRRVRRGSKDCWTLVPTRGQTVPLICPTCAGRVL